MGTNPVPVTFWRQRSRRIHVSCSSSLGIFLAAGLDTGALPELEFGAMTRGIGTLFLGAAVMSLFSTRPQGPKAHKARPQRPASSVHNEASCVNHASPEVPSRLLALVQTRPQTIVLAISESREELERELLELNETWNHWELRHERQRYEIQPAPVLRRIRETLSLRPATA